MQTQIFQNFEYKGSMGEQALLDLDSAAVFEESLQSLSSKAGVSYSEGVLQIDSKYSSDHPIVIHFHHNSSLDVGLKKISFSNGAQAKVLFLNPAFTFEGSGEKPSLEIELGRDAQVVCSVFNSTQAAEHQAFPAFFKLHANAHLDQKILGVSEGKLDYVFDYEFATSQSKVVLDGVYLASQKAKVRYLTKMLHKSRESFSHQEIRGFAAEDAKFNYDGLIHIFPDASLCSAKQYNHNILLSDEARVHTVPQLVIENDDVSCAHGATAGFLDKQQLFYLMSRGLSETVSREMLLKAFLEPFYENMADDQLRPYFKGVIDQWLQKLFITKN